ncbi:uncharacterized protein LOC111273627 isoform X3 [Varroa jacobsoni]|nr:uncharacterized protein LOC111246533 isoform X2 [Varroa destructor]XP_022652027.1 uncharacterized protein LOC111246533 isoform X2 [Varroa destructor]XP_022652028.1 uncharacterized protein LOC111246533 isoform X2 [Varroa destructor]XP_022711118.1 uncharacterized protein LOC111273627 isoform X3 [Varroa jacobsoni]XP_022711119.1 uncharacterized protein LOC111273627 isoform X3 [Varroa jacobsoni]XP_022711120.1 uncharacterized protein LOC111273627 isoform X3 [Varroa jacobsoni]XP_022711121.1 uncha
MSHRIIEKRRRDRMNNCLADLSRLIPAIYLKKGRGRIEKTEIIEMAIKHLKHLQAHACKDPATCEVAQQIENDHRHQYRLGFHECMSECVRFLVEIEGMYAGDDLCIRLMNHLQKHFDKVQGHGFCYQLPQGTTAASTMPGGVGAVSPPTAVSAGLPAPGAPSGLSSPCVTNASGQLIHQQTHQPTPVPIQIHPPSAEMVSAPLTVASSVLLSAGEDVKPMDLESTESSAFTRRVGGPFAPRGRLLQDVPQNPGSSPGNSVAQQMHHLMVPKQEGLGENGGSSVGGPCSAECKPCPGVEARSPVSETPTGSQAQASQLREMLQTPMAGSSTLLSGPPGLPACELNMRKRSNIDTHLSTTSFANHYGSGPTSTVTGEPSPAKTPNILQQQQQQTSATTNPNEEVYNFKKNIKERFQSNLRLFSASPTDSVDGEDSKGFTGREERRYSHSQVQGPVASPRSPASFYRHTVSAPPMGELVDAEPVTLATDLSVSVDKSGRPPREIRESREIRDNSRECPRGGDGCVVKWESTMTMNQLDSSNSAGSPPGSSNPSSRSSASSGYSSNGSSVEAGTRHPVTSPPSPAPPVLAQALTGSTPCTNGALNTSTGPNSTVSTGVPIFALHPKRAFYIPLTMESSLLTPFLQADDEAGSPVLHPVSISVNFNQLYRKNITATPQAPPWICVRAAEPRLPLLLPNGRL